MDRYDPLVPPVPEEWLAMDEGERIALVAGFHRRARIRLPNAQAHAVFHVIVENQVAIGEGIPVGATLDRLMANGLDRHDAIHAIASVLAAHVTDVVRGGDEQADPNGPYYAALARLMAKSWQNA